MGVGHEARTTRGNGLAEGWLSRKRHEKARALFGEEKVGALLDVGAGGSGDALGFVCKVRVDPILGGDSNRLNWYPGGFFDGAAMLAVIEHMTKPEAEATLADIRRALAPGAKLVLTTPAKWAGPLLRFLAVTGWVSGEEIDEHKSAWSQKDLREALGRAGFRVIRTGRFLWGLNQWALATRP